MSVPMFQLAPDLNVSRLCLGTMTFGEQNSFDDSCRLMNEAFAAGINFFDTAEMLELFRSFLRSFLGRFMSALSWFLLIFMSIFVVSRCFCRYPVPQKASTQGNSEMYIGRWLRRRKIPRYRLVLATKVTGPAQMTWIRDGPMYVDASNIKKAIDGSLLRLGTEYIDLYQIHWPDRYVPMFGETSYDPKVYYVTVPIEEQLEALGRAVDDGKIRYIGVSNETPYGVMEFCHLAETVRQYPRIVSIQNAYNLLCRNFDSGLAECCHHQRVGLLAYSPLAMGLLSGKYFDYRGGPPDARFNLFKGKYAEGESRYSFSRKNAVAAIKEYMHIAEKYCTSPVMLAIAFVLRHPLVASAVFGATKLSQLREILKSCEIQLTPEIISELDEVHNKYPNPCP